VQVPSGSGHIKWPAAYDSSVTWPLNRLRIATFDECGTFRPTDGDRLSKHRVITLRGDGPFIFRVHIYLCCSLQRTYINRKMAPQLSAAPLLRRGGSTIEILTSLARATTGDDHPSLDAENLGLRSRGRKDTLPLTT
jgi:hypothetical protein